MRFLTIEPDEMAIGEIEAPNAGVAKVAILGDIDVDHGVVDGPKGGVSLAIIVDEYSLLDTNDQKFFSIGDKLFAGKAVIYGFDGAGETVSIPEDDDRISASTVVFMKGVEEVEAAITSGRLPRPRAAINGEVIWEWNKPAPPE